MTTTKFALYPAIQKSQIIEGITRINQRELMNQSITEKYLN